MKKAITAVRIISIISVVFFLFYPINFFSIVFSFNEIQEISFSDAVSLLFFAYAWCAWMVMGVAWVAQRQLHRFWPISGCVTGGICLIFVLPFVIPALLVLPAVLLAVTFCKFHLHSNFTQQGVQLGREKRAG